MEGAKSRSGEDTAEERQLLPSVGPENPGPRVVDWDVTLWDGA